MKSSRCRLAAKPTLVVLATLLTSGAALGDERFTPPADADADALVAYIRGLVDPGVEFNSRSAADAYRRRAAKAIAKAADQILAGELTDDQAREAIEFKLNSLRLLEGLGDRKGRPSADQFLRKLRQHENQVVALAALRTRVQDCVGHWRTLRRRERDEVFNEVTTAVASAEVNPCHVKLVTCIADQLGDSADRDRVLRLVAEVRPTFQQSEDPAVAEKLAALDGVVRRLRLPGEPIEVEGELLSGERIDWQKYRGKVVLIDYWATWCGICHAELPNVRRMHEKYADQGFEVIGVSVDEDPKSVERFVKDHSIPWQTLVGHTAETRGWRHPMVAKYGVYDLPRAILVDRQGRVVDVNARGEQLVAELDRLFSAPVAADSVNAGAELVSASASAADGRQ